MGVKTTTKVWEWSQAEGTDRLVMLALADWCDDENVCYPGVTKIAKKCRVSERTVQRSFQVLMNMGELTIDRGAGITTKSGPTNLFRLHFRRGDNMTPGVNQGAEGVTSGAQRGDIAVSPKPSVEPSVEPSGAQAPALPLEVEKKSKPFRPPTKPEVEHYLAELGMNGSAGKEAEKFLNYHDARGWTVGRQKAKDWRAMARTWKGNAEEFAARDAAPAPGTGKPDDGHLPDWNAWLKAHGHPLKHAGKEGYQFAPEFLKSDFWKERKKDRAAT